MQLLKYFAVLAGFKAVVTAHQVPSNTLAMTWHVRPCDDIVRKYVEPATDNSSALKCGVLPSIAANLNMVVQQNDSQLGFSKSNASSDGLDVGFRLHRLGNVGVPQFNLITYQYLPGGSGKTNFATVSAGYGIMGIANAGQLETNWARFKYDPEQGLLLGDNKESNWVVGLKSPRLQDVINNPNVDQHWSIEWGPDHRAFEIAFPAHLHLAPLVMH